MTLIQRFGSALNLNFHFHGLVLDGAYLVGTDPPVFRRIAPPGVAELQQLVERVAERIGRALERQGVLVREAEGSYLELGPDAGGPLDDLIGHSITYRVAGGAVRAEGSDRIGDAERAESALRSRGGVPFAVALSRRIGHN